MSMAKARSALAENFTKVLFADWEKRGEDVLAQVRKVHPTTYLQVVAQLLPRTVELEIDTYDEMTDAELMSRIRELNAELRSQGLDFDR